MIINIDTQAKAAYIKLKEGTCHHTKEILPEVFADFNSHNEIIGVELVSPCTITLRKLARKLKLPIFNKIKKPLEEVYIDRLNPRWGVLESLKKGLSRRGEDCNKVSSLLSHYTSHTKYQNYSRRLKHNALKFASKYGLSDELRFCF